jgi:predicted nucleic acid-binding protein
MGLKNSWEIRAMTQWRDRFIHLKRLVVPTVATLTLIGDACLQLRSSGKLDPAHPKHYNDISIAALAHQVGAILLTKNSKDFLVIQQAIDFEFERIA